ncbi:MAG TPA: PD-(D/E)XK nuclease family protein [Acidimicrobiales bacterium]|nr:PD-(D/E)XK nuclease family protein [Acidimicrobiales bacterium]
MPTAATRPVVAAVLEREGLLRRLRGDGVPRPAIDPGLAGGLRDWLEDGLVEAVAGLAPGIDVVRVNKESLNQVLLCEAHLVARRNAPRVATVELARGSMVDALFRQWVTIGVIDDPWGDALAAFEVEGDRDGVITFVTGLPATHQRRLRAEVAEHATHISERWPVLSPAWLPRTQERLEVPLCGGRVVLAGVVDLVLGGPAQERASVCLVELKSGARRIEHRPDLHFYALLEALRSGAPPFRIATYYSGTGELDAEPVEEDTLVSALSRALDGAIRLCRVSSGAEPERHPNQLCAWCVGLPGCAPGQQRVGTDVPLVTAGRAETDRGQA